MSKKIRVGILFGGKSAEHEVSLRSAKNVLDAIDKDKYEPVLIGIDKSGKWQLGGKSDLLLKSGNSADFQLSDTNTKVTIAPQSEGEITNLESIETKQSIDVIFPILHGPFGEDGTVQGLLKLANIPFVGASVLGSAVGMDKDVMKRLLRDANIPIGKFLVVSNDEKMDYEEVVEKIGSPFFVKPANLGSSVGVHKVSKEEDYTEAISYALNYDRKIILEEYIKGREIECSVLGNENPIASIPGEVIPKHDFYSYEAKYLDENGAKLEIPAKLDEDTVTKIKKMAVDTFKVLCCEGFARVDFFLKDNGDILVNEINTIPGFTSISMYPKLWEISGIPYTELIDRLIKLAIERFNKEQKLKTSYIPK